MDARNQFVITENFSSCHKQQLLSLYRQTWWADHREREEMNAIIENSSFIVGIIDSSNDSLIGFARILTDYFTLAYIFDVIICESYRGKSLGKRLMNHIIHHEKLKNVTKIELACRETMIPFYQQFGFLETNKDTIVMRRNNPDKLTQP